MFIVFYLFISLTTSTLPNEIDRKEKITYNNNISSIIESKCVNCHNGTKGRKDFSTYENLLPVLLNGKFEKRVIKKRTMPKKPITLNDEEYDLIKKWYNNGYPE